MLLNEDQIALRDPGTLTHLKAETVNRARGRDKGYYK